MKVLRLTDDNVKLARQHAEIKGKKPIARGCFSAIFDGSKPSTVFKLTVDPIGYWMLNCSAARVEGKHFPKVVQDLQEVGTTNIRSKEYSIYLFEMERLLPLKRYAENYQEARSVVTGTWNMGRKSFSTSDRIGSILTSNQKISRSVKRALKELERFAKDYGNNMALDMHMGNFMQRKDGTLVITDPMAEKCLFEIATGRFERAY